MLDHLGIQCTDMAASAAFYDAVLAPLGGPRMMDFGVAMGYGIDKPDFWIGALVRRGLPGVSHRFSAQTADRPRVLRRRGGGRRRGAARTTVWPEYHPNYYGAFVRDPDGNNVEAVCHAPESG